MTPKPHPIQSKYQSLSELGPLPSLANHGKYFHFFNHLYLVATPFLHSFGGRFIVKKTTSIEMAMPLINLWFLLLLLLINALGPWASWEGSPIPRMTRQGCSFCTRGMVGGRGNEKFNCCGSIQIL
ncbi:hypothetical protein NC653_026416 [Populus alba x Populus x berolinensis]|uniref:Uncharacterized protein n=1 Tax=Populus alba x Populus x berolinensis TaxID=444605 RepID=A0AAD6QB43_9ROSI|nr:hypothetical protein NC653_026416 [Populus alba x Populus x berolinensis]